MQVLIKFNAGHYLPHACCLPAPQMAAQSLACWQRGCIAHFLTGQVEGSLRRLNCQLYFMLPRLTKALNLQHGVVAGRHSLLRADPWKNRSCILCTILSVLLIHFRWHYPARGCCPAIECTLIMLPCDCPFYRSTEVLATY